LFWIWLSAFGWVYVGKGGGRRTFQVETGCSVLGMSVGKSMIVKALKGLHFLVIDLEHQIKFISCHVDYSLLKLKFIK
jgi:hypothetical protein